MAKKAYYQGGGEIRCPHCNVELELELNEVEQANCPECGHTFRLDSVSAVEPQHFDNVPEKRIKEYRLLYSYGKTYSAIGWFIVILGALIALFSIIAGISRKQELVVIAGIVIGLIAAGNGILVVVIGQFVTLFVSMHQGIQDIRIEVVKMNKSKEQSHD